MKRLGKLNGKNIFYTALEHGWTSCLPKEPFIGLLFSDYIRAYYEASVIEICSSLLSAGCRYVVAGGENSRSLEFGCDTADISRLEGMSEKEQDDNFCPSESYHKLNEAFYRAIFVVQPVIKERTRKNRGQFKNVVVLDFDDKIENDIIALIEHYSKRHAVTKRKAKFMKAYKNKKMIDDFI